MKRSLLILILFSVLSQLSEAQLWKLKRYELSGGLGPTFFFGDVGGYTQGENILGIKDATFLQTRINGDISFKYRISQTVNARMSISGGLLKATDERGSNEERGYEASTAFFEPALIGEYYFIKNRSENSYLFVSSGKRFFSTLFKSLDFFVFTGVGGMMYTVSGNDALESDPKFNSGGFTAVIPVGVGTNLVYSPNFNFGVEFGGRYAFSDYLDGYTSQYSSSNDVYYFLNFVVTYKVKTGKNGWPSFR
jgi:hypothetical protein